MGRTGALYTVKVAPRRGARRWSEAGERRTRSTERIIILTAFTASHWTFSTCPTLYQQLGELDPMATLRCGDHLIQGFLSLNTVDVGTG